MAAVTIDLQNPLTLIRGEALGGGLLRAFELSSAGCVRVAL